MRDIWNEGASLLIESKAKPVWVEKKKLQERFLDNSPTWTDIHMQNLVECWKRNSEMFRQFLCGFRQ